MSGLKQPSRSTAAGLSTQAIRSTWCRLNAGVSEVWLCPRGDRVELRVLSSPPRTSGAVKVGSYNSSVLLPHFIEDVGAAFAEIGA